MSDLKQAMIDIKPGGLTYVPRKMKHHPTKEESLYSEINMQYEVIKKLKSALKTCLGELNHASLNECGLFYKIHSPLQKHETTINSIENFINI